MTTDRGEIAARAVVIATGACNQPTVPPLQRRGAGVGAAADAVRLPRPGRAARRRGPGGGRVGDRRAARGRARALRAAGDPLGRGAHAAAAHLPGTRRALVDGRVRGVGPALRRARRPHPGPAAALAPAGRDARADHARPQRARLDRRRAGRPPGRRPRRPGAVLRRPAQRVLAGRPQDEPPPRHVRRMGRGRTAATPRSTPPSASSRPGCPLSTRLQLDLGSGEIRVDRVGDRLPPRLRLARRARGRRRRASCATTAAWSTAPACTRSACRCCAAASPRSSTASRTTPAR